MKKLHWRCFVLLSVLFLICCNNASDKKLTGKWKLEVMNINGTSIRGSSLGSWLWEFKENGGYLINVEGTIDEGTYKLNRKTLTLSSITNKERPEQTYTIAKLDSISLNLVSSTEKNKTSLSFIKMKGELAE